MDLLQMTAVLKSYPKGVAEEVKKISWPSRQVTKQQTLVVAVVVAVSMALIATMDAGFTQLIALILQQ